MTKLRICYLVSGVICILFTTFMITLVLAQTVFKPKHPILQTVDILVGNLTLPSTTLPAKGSALLPCPLVLQIDKFVADLGGILQDILQRKIVIEGKSQCWESSRHI
ncbi:hypothetical protein YC2023_006481 [Brassica napus]